MEQHPVEHRALRMARTIDSRHIGKADSKTVPEIPPKIKKGGMPNPGIRPTVRNCSIGGHVPPDSWGHVPISTATLSASMSGMTFTFSSLFSIAGVPAFSIAVMASAVLTMLVYTLYFSAASYTR